MHGGGVARGRDGQQLSGVAPRGRFLLQHLVMSGVERETSVEVGIGAAKAPPVESMVVRNRVMHHEVQFHLLKDINGVGRLRVVKRELAKEVSGPERKYAGPG